MADRIKYEHSYAGTTFALANTEEDAPTKEELEIIKAYQNGVPEYQPVYSQEEVIKELGL